MKKPKLLFVDDEQNVLDDLEEIFGYIDKYELFRADSGRKALAILRQHDIDLVITDIKMPEMDGLELAGIIRGSHPSVKVIFITAVEDLIKLAIKLDPLDIIEKPIRSDILLHKVEKYFESKSQINMFKLAAIAGSIFALLEGLSSAIAIIKDAAFLDVIRGLITISLLGFFIAVIIRFWTSERPFTEMFRKNTGQRNRRENYLHWKKTIDLALANHSSADLHFISKNERDYVKNLYLQERSDLNIFYDDISETFQIKRSNELIEFRKIWDQIRSNDVRRNNTLFEKLTLSLTNLLCSVLSFKTSSKIKQFEDKVAILVDAPTLRLNTPDSFPVVYFSEEEFSEKDVHDIIGLLRALGANRFFALLVILGDPQRVRPLIQQYALNYDFIIFDREIFWQIFAAKSPIQKLSATILQQVDPTRISPYVSEGPVPEKMYFGRTKEEKTILQSISDKNFAVVGGRKIGKTSLLDKINRLLSKDSKYLSLFFDLQAVKTYKDFFKELCTSAILADIEKSNIADVPMSFSKLVKSITQHYPNKRVIFIFDEVDELLERDLKNDELLFRTFRKIAQQNLCRFIFCGSKTLVKRIRHPNSPFFNFCQEIRVGVLEERYARELIISPMRDMGIAFEDNDFIIKRIVELSSCHPNIIQYICHQLLDRINEKKLRFVSLKDFDMAVTSPKFYNYFLNTIWSQSTVVEKLIIYLMLDRPSFGLEEVRTKLAQRKLDIRNLKDSFDALELYSVLENKAGKYELVFKSLSRRILQNNNLEELINEEIQLLTNGYAEKYLAEVPTKHTFSIE